MTAQEVYGTHLRVPGTPPPPPPPKGLRQARRGSAVSSNGGMLLQKVEQLGNGKIKTKLRNIKSADTLEWLEKLPSDPIKNQALDQLGRSVSLLARERQFSTLCTILAIIASLTVTCCYINSSVYFEILLSATTVIHIISVLLLHKIQYKRDLIWRPEWLKGTGMDEYQTAMLIGEVLLISIHKPPTIDAVPKIINVIVIARLFTAVRTLRDMSFASSMGSILVGALCNIKMDSFFVFKTRLFSSPILTMSLTSGIGLILLSFLTWFVESSYGDLNLAQSFWFTFITATTVGYGDYTPSSVGGKIVGVVSALFGIVVTAILVSVVQHKLLMTGIEKQIILFLSEVQRVQQTKLKAARVVRQAMIYSQLKAIVRKSGKQIPEHRTYLSSVLTTSTTIKVLYRAWINLQEAVEDMRKLRRVTSTAWAHISVLDVLHADSSDILAQNTVLQYLMRPADEQLSAMLRVGKYNPIANKSRRRQSLTVSPPVSSPPPEEDEVEQIELKEVRTEGSDGKHSTDDDDGSDSSPRSRRSRGSVTSLTSTNSVRTAASTAAMVDMLKLAVGGATNAGTPRRIKPKRMRRAFEEDDQEDPLSGASYEGDPSLLTSPLQRRFAPSHLRSPGTGTTGSNNVAATLESIVTSQKKLENMMMHMMKELCVTPFPASVVSPPSPAAVQDAFPPRAAYLELDRAKEAG